VSGVLPARRSDIEKWVWALIRAIDIPRIFRSGNTVSGKAVVESRRVAGWLTKRVAYGDIIAAILALFSLLLLTHQQR
jgi:hypothetical protein